MIYELKSSIDVYLQSLDLVLIVGFILLVTSALLLHLLPEYIYLSTFGIFIRISKLTEIDLFQMFLIILFYLITMFIYSLVFVVLTLATKEYRTEQIPKEAFIKNIKHSLPEVYMFFIFWFLLQLSISIYGYVYSFDSWVLSIIIFLISYILILIPYAIVIEEVNFEKAIKKIYLFRKELLIYPLIYGIIATLANLITIFLINIVLPLEVIRWLMLLINVFLFLPFLIILGANLYFNKFTLSIRRI